MDYFPLFLDLTDKRVLIVGGGIIALRKAKLLAPCSCKITLVAPKIIPEMQQLIEKHKGMILQRKFKKEDIEGAYIVVVAIDDEKEQKNIHKLAIDRDIPVNVVDNKKLCTFIVPAIVDRDPIIAAITSGGKSPVIARRIREDLEASLSDDYALMSDFMDEVRPLVKKDLPEEQRRYFYEKLWDSQARHLLAHNKKKQALALAKKILKAQKSQMKQNPNGMVWLAGAGPGDAELLTLKTLRLMHQADVILADRLISEDILKMARRDSKLIRVGKPEYSQQEINHIMLKYSSAGLQVLRLKGGDPAVFGRLNEELAFLDKHKIDYAVAPGISAALACAAQANMSLTDRNLAHAMIFLSLHAKSAAKDKKMSQLNPYVAEILRDNSRDDRTLVIYMGVDNIDLGVKEMIAAKMSGDTSALVFEKIGYPDAKIFATKLISLPQAMKKHKTQAPATIIIGKAAKLANFAV